MSALAVTVALQKALASISPALATVYENEEYTPVEGTPYQIVTATFADPLNAEMGRSYQDRGVFDIVLCYPPKVGAGDALARAMLIRAAFYRGRSLSEDGITTTIETTPAILGAIGGVPDRYALPVRIRFYANVAA